MNIENYTKQWEAVFTKAHNIEGGVQIEFYNNDLGLIRAIWKEGTDTHETLISVHGIVEEFLSRDRTNNNGNI